jgi:hypothetical protein
LSAVVPQMKEAALETRWWSHTFGELLEHGLQLLAGEAEMIVERCGVC